MIRTESRRRWFTPPQVAEQLAVDSAKVIAWIRSGALAAVNVGNGATRPRYRVAPEAFEEFLRRRSTQPAAKPVRTRRIATVKEFV
jgi:excisionase family DNA binding protein